MSSDKRNDIDPTVNGSSAKNGHLSGAVSEDAGKRRAAAQILLRAQQGSLGGVRDWLTSGIYRGLRLSSYAFALVLIWVLVLKFGLVRGDIADALTLPLVIALFVLGLPTALVFGVNNLFLGMSQERSLLLSSAILCLNFIVIATLSSVYRGFRQRLRASQNTKGKS